MVIFKQILEFVKDYIKNDSLGFGLTINPAVNMVYDKWNKNFWIMASIGCKYLQRHIFKEQKHLYTLD